MKNKTGHKKICFLLNYGAHYRMPIYEAIGREFSCDFVFGSKAATDIKPLDYQKLTGFRRVARTLRLGKFYWLRGAVKLLCEPYDYYVFTGDQFCLTYWVMLLKAKVTRKKMVAWAHGWYGKESRLTRWMKGSFLRKFDELLIYNERSMALLEELGFDPARMHCIANSLDSDRQREIRERLTPRKIYREHFHNAAPTLIYCGRIQAVKRLDVLLDALVLQHRAGQTVNCVFVGKDVDGVHLDEMIKERGLEHQTWLYGPCYNEEELAELFYNASACVSPGNVGLTAIHALSYGCPVLTHDDLPWQMPEFEAIQPGVTGDFFRRDDAEDLCRCLTPWVVLTTEKRDEMRKAAYAEIDRKWNIHYQLQVLHEVFPDA